jgi:subtilisin
MSTQRFAGAKRPGELRRRLLQRRDGDRLHHARVAIVSTVPGGYAAWGRTSMACPPVSGAAAALLARERRALRMVPGQARSDEMARLVFAAARSLGFGVQFEGRGML